MSDIKRNEIIYEEGWRETAPVVNAETPVDEEPVNTVEPIPKPRESKPLLITIQLVLCLLAALILFLLKAMDSEGYYSFMDYYREELQKPVVSQELFRQADIGKMFADNIVEVQTTPDETAPSQD
ncbi:MAG: hypothetical protein IJG87_03110 [Ruminococcus sp.]|nr:hypothetical protein [Ruminococcus sp.]